MKKRILIAFVLLIFGSLSFVQTYAKETTRETKNSENVETFNYFDYFEDEDKILQTPDGGWLKGQAYLEFEDGTIIEYDSNTDPNAMTAREAKELYRD